ncbi:hypothetical protein [Azospirillum canadense]|uniref:hypothetical protein n=1 Tax=Azospirillum canadense TaxID=403962 RepID=UPI0022268D59|nr:hypothetical protein [Azospirillum canadense]MCW2243946.1 hypothetical protein [Azospirillum canadense]
MKLTKNTTTLCARSGRVERTERIVPPQKANAEQQRAAKQLFRQLSTNVSVSGWKPYVKAS